MEYTDGRMVLLTMETLKMENDTGMVLGWRIALWNLTFTKDSMKMIKNKGEESTNGQMVQFTLALSQTTKSILIII
jgi:hypothetical protein